MSTLQDITKSFLDEIKKVNLSHSPVDWVHARFPKANGGNGFQLWSKQIEIANSVYENQQTIVASCHSGGKTKLAAFLTAWFVETYGTEGVVITTAPTSHQVYSVLWQEINKLGLYADPPLPGKILQTEWKIGKLGNERFQVAYGRATREYDSSAFQGKHCLDDQHEILTHRGWCNIDEINQNDEVLSVPLNGELAEWMPITNIYKYDYDGELLIIDNHPMLNFAVTPSHRFVFKGYNQKKWQLTTLINCTLTHPIIRRVSSWVGVPFQIPETFAKYHLTHEQFLEFLGRWITEGNIGGTRAYEVAVTQVKERTKSIVEKVMQPFGCYKTKDGWAFSNKSVAQWLIEHCGRYSHERCIPRFILDSTCENLRCIVDAIMFGDGTGNDGTGYQLYTTSKTLADQIQEIGIKLGCGASLGVNRCAGNRKVCGRDELAYHKTAYAIRANAQNNHGSNPHINLKHIKIQRYCGKIWCISTPYETFVTRRKGKIMWTGNSDNVLLIIDEAAGIQPPIWDAVRGLLASARSRLLVLGNPTEVSGGFYDLANTERFGRKIFHINAFETPNLISSGIRYVEPPEQEDGKHIWRVDMLKQLEPLLNKEDYPYPGLVTPQWVYNQLSDYPLSDPFIEARVFGRFPKFSEDTIIPFAWIVAAQQRWMDIAPGDVVGDGHIGVDPAAYGGNESVCAIRIGNYVAKFVTRGRTTAQQMVSDINSAVEYLESRNVLLNSIRIDSAGIGIRTCEDLDHSLLGEKSFPINVGSAARDKIRYANLRAELWFKFKELLDPNNPNAIALPPDDKLASQLSAPKYKFNNHRQLIVESKEDLRSRGIKDLGRADATILASIAIEQMHYFSRRGSRDTKSVVPFIPLYQR